MVKMSEEKEVLRQNLLFSLKENDNINENNKYLMKENEVFFL